MHSTFPPQQVQLAQLLDDDHFLKNLASLMGLSSPEFWQQEQQSKRLTEDQARQPAAEKA